ncbi:1808_t:CDS:2 [Scutellospora calospora]|uniref:1808_t:CDS:1 n=1 Tax=Scutellospora calospora TaxID=85575 RepID=A0ACA9KD79_9GLOM|nr:1808_t:CDS:2 [Scutellospora calospora]
MITSKEYTNECIRHYLKNDTTDWTSGNKFIDDFIRDSYTSSTLDTIIEWVPMDHFKDFEFKAKGGFGSIFMATWVDGWIDGWDQEAQKFVRSKPGKVVLKMLDKSNNANIDFFKKAISNVTLTNLNCVKCYGLTKHPDSLEYMLILKYLNNGNLNTFLFNKNNKYGWKRIYLILQQILNGLCSIHHLNMIHKDIHPGNILSDQAKWYISDFGICEIITSRQDFLCSQTNLSINKSEIIDYQDIPSPKNKYNSDNEYAQTNINDLLVIKQVINNENTKFYNKNEEYKYLHAKNYISVILNNNLQNSLKGIGHVQQMNDNLLMPHKEVNRKDKHIEVSKEDIREKVSREGNKCNAKFNPLLVISNYYFY